MNARRGSLLMPVLLVLLFVPPRRGRYAPFLTVMCSSF
jgi:hypothetical protein